MIARIIIRALIATTVALVPVSAEATWSLSAVDPATGEVGIAGATCWSEIERIGGLAPGIGVVAAQAWAWYDSSLRDRLVQRLLEGASPQTAINTLTAVEPDSHLHQYGVVDLHQRTATFTGDYVEDWRGSYPGTGVTVQGNLLTGPAVIDWALAGFYAGGPTLADRLLTGLETGALQGGDARCPWGQTALSAFMRVARPHDHPAAPFIDLVVPEQPFGGANPVALLRQMYDNWRHSTAGTPAPPAQPDAPAQPAPPAPSGGFAIGQRVKVIQNPIDGSRFVNVRATAGGEWLGTQPVDAIGTIVNGPQSSVVLGSDNPTAFTYWLVSYDSGVVGWSGEINHILD